jgi:hypothetical protein
MAPRTARHRIRESAWWRAYGRARYAILFYTLLLTLLVLPVASTVGLPTVTIKILLAACLLSAIMPNASRRTRHLLFGAVMLLIAARFASEYGYLPVNSRLVLALVGVTGIAAAGLTLRFVIGSRKVDDETIYAALGTYLLAGVFFGQIYWSIERLWPGSLTGPDPTTELTSIYFSFVTLATLGYGDFLPRTEIIRGVATFEVIAGQLFLAVMVARLIGLFVPGASHSAARKVSEPPPSPSAGAASHSRKRT